MSQHLYPCECCGVHGVAHYPLRAVPGTDPVEYVNVLVCTGCHQAGCVAQGSCQKKDVKKGAAA